MVYSFFKHMALFVTVLTACISISPAAKFIENQMDSDMQFIDAVIRGSCSEVDALLARPRFPAQIDIIFGDPSNPNPQYQKSTALIFAVAGKHASLVSLLLNRAKKFLSIERFTAFMSAKDGLNNTAWNVATIIKSGLIMSIFLESCKEFVAPLSACGQTANVTPQAYTTPITQAPLQNYAHTRTLPAAAIAQQKNTTDKNELTASSTPNNSSSSSSQTRGHSLQRAHKLLNCKKKHYQHP